MKQKIHMEMMELKTSLVLSGYVWNKGPFMAMKNLGSDLQILMNNLMYLEKWAKEMGDDMMKMELPDYMEDLFTNVYLSSIKLHNHVLKVLPGKGEELIMKVRGPDPRIGN